MRTLYEFDYKDYKENGTVGIRPSVRGIIIRNGRLAMVHSRKYDYFAFPGGGIDQGEKKEEALIREIREELGLEVIPGSIREYGLMIRKEKGAIDDLFIQENYYYLCDVSDRHLKQELGGYEVEEAYELCWTDPDEALKANRENDHGELSNEAWAKHLYDREAMLIGKLREEGLLGTGLPEAITLLRAEEEWQRAGAYSVRIQGMNRQHHISLRDEFDEHDGEGTKYIVLLDKGYPVATCRFYELSEDTATIGRVVVLPEYRGKKLGAYVVQEAERWIAECGYREIVVDSRTVAVGFYEKLGYRKECEDVIRSGVFDCVKMRKSL